jgi:excinuclease ABC subunit C
MFEKAATVRDQIKAIETVIRKQEVMGIPLEEADIFYFIGKKVYLIVIRGHTIIGKEELKLHSEEFEEGNEVFILTSYYTDNYIPEKIVLNKPVEDLENFRQWLLKSKNKEVEIEFNIPQTIENFIKRNIKVDDLDSLKESFEKTFGFSLPSRIECFDISHLQ